jgi:predicted transcriptional regulator
MAPEHVYRTKIEVLRDFLRAARDPAPKTRIIGAANLNPISFQRYLRFCTENHLVTATSGGYVVTPRAARILEAIEGVITKTAELEGAVHFLENSALTHPIPNDRDDSALRYASREAWGEIALGCAGKREDPAGSRSLKDLPVDRDVPRTSRRTRTSQAGRPRTSSRPSTRHARPGTPRAGSARRRTPSRSRSGR